MSVDLSGAATEEVYRAVIPDFRPNGRGQWRGPASYRGGDNPTALSVDLEKGVWFDHVTGQGGDVVDFVKLCLDTDFVGAVRAIEHIIGHDLLKPHHQRTRPRYSESQLTKAELFRIGFRWDIERRLASAKEQLFGPQHDQAAPEVRALTQDLASCERWTPYGAADAMRQADAALVRACVAEVNETYDALAALIRLQAEQAAA